MTIALPALEIVTKLEAALPESVVESSGNSVVVKDEFLFKVASFLKTNPELGKRNGNTWFCFLGMLASASM